jgi:hypothetical protein
MLEQKDVDAVVVATPDHVHAEVALAALASGRHVYVEKPFTRRLDDAFRIMDAAQRSGCLVQLGTQGCSEPKWQKAREVVRSGQLGRLLWAQGSYCRHNPNGEWNYDIDPDASERTVEWKRWLGPAPKRPWSPERYFRWRKYWDYGTGVIGDLLPTGWAADVRDGDQRVPAGLVHGRHRRHRPRAQPVTESCGEKREVADTHVVIVEFCRRDAVPRRLDEQRRHRGRHPRQQGEPGAAAARCCSSPSGRRGRAERRPTPPEDLSETPEPVATPSTSSTSSVPCGTAECPDQLACQVQAVVSMAEKAYRERRLVSFDPQAASSEREARPRGDTTRFGS